MASEEELIAARRKHAGTLTEAGTSAFPNGFVGDDALRREVLAIANDEARRAALPGEGELPEDAAHYPLYGRIIAKRGPFLVIQTPHGQAQALVRPENLSPSDAASYAQVDLADHAAVWGPLLRTRTGALTVKALRYQHLGKALLPPPAKWHGLTDVELRYRQRYVDLFANPEVAEVFRARSFILAALRRFLDDHAFLEVETPILHPLLGGATARPFSTHHNALDVPLYLRVAPELYLKRLLVGGFDRVYELGRMFRNEGVSTRHNPEFTMLEAYMAYATCDSWIDLLEKMLRAVESAVSAAYPRFEAARTVAFRDPWARVSMRQAVADRLERAGQGDVPPTRWSKWLTPSMLFDEAALCSAIEAALPSLDDATRNALTKHRTYGGYIIALFELIAEPDLVKLYRSTDAARSVPVFITEFPVEESPLARRNDLDPRFVDRFELFVEGRELANAFSELNDPDDQAARFQQQLEQRERGDIEAMDYDHDYIRALQHGLPPSAGLGIGIDRLVMSMCAQSSIRDVLLFPLLKPESR